MHTTHTHTHKHTTQRNQHDANEFFFNFAVSLEVSEKSCSTCASATRSLAAKSPPFPIGYLKSPRNGLFSPGTLFKIRTVDASGHPSVRGQIVSLYLCLFVSVCVCVCVCCVYVCMWLCVCLYVCVYVCVVLLCFCVVV